MKVKIERLIPHPKNPNVHKDSQIDEIVRSVEKFGQYRPILVDEGYTILAGHGLTQAMQRMGETTVDVRVMKGLSDDDKLKLLLVDNQLSALGSIDYTVVEDIFRDLEDFDIPGFDQSVLEDLLSKTEEMISDYGKVENSEGLGKDSFFESGETTSSESIVCPRCGMELEKKNL